MKPTHGILYQIDGKIVCAEREMPSKVIKGRIDIVSVTEANKIYEQNIKSWLESCKDVVNAEMYDAGSEGLVPFIVIGKRNYQPVFPQKVLFVPEGEKVRIVELK